MSGQNTKDSKINRILARQLLDSEYLNAITKSIAALYAKEATRKLLAEAFERVSNSLDVAIQTSFRLEAENARLREYLGSELFARRQREMQIPTLGQIRCAECGGFGAHSAGCPESNRKPGQPYRPSCNCAEGACRGYSYCRFGK